MKRILLTSFLVAIIVACAGSAKQHVVTAPPIVPKASLRVNDSVSFKASPELQKSLDELAASIQAMALRLANDPELRAAAMKVASGFVASAQQVVDEQSDVLQEALKTAAQKIAEAQAAQRRAPKKN
jgi:predicted transcriptional regulator